MRAVLCYGIGAGTEPRRAGGRRTNARVKVFELPVSAHGKLVAKHRTLPLRLARLERSEALPEYLPFLPGIWSMAVT